MSPRPKGNDPVYPRIRIPISSEAELREIDPKLLAFVATCAPRDRAAGVDGCPVYELCDLPFKDHGARVVKCRQWKAGMPREVALHCSVAVRMREERELNDDAMEILPNEDTYMASGTQRVHPRRDPECQECMQNRCTRVTHNLTPMKVIQDPPLSEHPELSRFVNAARIRRGNRAKRRTDLMTQTYTNEPREANEPVAAASEREPEAAAAEPAGVAGGGEPRRRGRPPGRAST